MYSGYHEKKNHHQNVNTCMVKSAYFSSTINTGIKTSKKKSDLLFQPLEQRQSSQINELGSIGKGSSVITPGKSFSYKEVALAPPGTLPIVDVRLAPESSFIWDPEQEFHGTDGTFVEENIEDTFWGRRDENGALESVMSVDIEKSSDVFQSSECSSNHTVPNFIDPPKTGIFRECSQDCSTVDNVEETLVGDTNNSKLPASAAPFSPFYCTGRYLPTNELPLIESEGFLISSKEFHGRSSKDKPHPGIVWVQPGRLAPAPPKLLELMSETEKELVLRRLALSPPNVLEHMPQTEEIELPILEDVKDDLLAGGEKTFGIQFRGKRNLKQVLRMPYSLIRRPYRSPKFKVSYTRVVKGAKLPRSSWFEF